MAGSQLWRKYPPRGRTRPGTCSSNAPKSWPSPIWMSRFTSQPFAAPLRSANERFARHFTELMASRRAGICECCGYPRPDVLFCPRMGSSPPSRRLRHPSVSWSLDAFQSSIAKYSVKVRRRLCSAPSRAELSRPAVQTAGTVSVWWLEDVGGFAMPCEANSCDCLSDFSATVAVDSRSGPFLHSDG